MTGLFKFLGLFADLVGKFMQRLRDHEMKQAGAKEALNNADKEEREQIVVDVRNSESARADVATAAAAGGLRDNDGFRRD